MTGTERTTVGGNGFSPAAFAWLPCVTPLHSSPERLAALRATVRDEPDPLVTVTDLLHLRRDEHRVLWEQVGSPAVWATVSDTLAPPRTLVESPPGCGNRGRGNVLTEVGRDAEMLVVGGRGHGGFVGLFARLGQRALRRTRRRPGRRGVSACGQDAEMTIRQFVPVDRPHERV